MAKFNGILFDLDGTLVDSHATTFDAFNHGIVSEGGQRHTPREIMAYFGPGEGEIFRKILAPLGDAEVRASRAYLRCREYLDAHIDQVPLHDGIGEMLEALKSAGTPLAIVTGRSWNTTETILQHHRLLDRFVTVVANDHVESPKPSPAGLYLAHERMKLKPSETFYVGDSHVDMIAARSAGSHGVGALWDVMAQPDQLLAYKPYQLIRHPREVCVILGER